MDEIEIVKNETADLLKFFDSPKFVVKLENNTLKVEIEAENAGVLIGKFGATLAAVQQVLNLTCAKEAGRWLDISVDVNSWRRGRQEKLQSLVEKTVEIVIQTGKSKALPPFSSIDRKFVHNLIGRRDNVTSFSEGYGKFRHVVVAPKT